MRIYGILLELKRQSFKSYNLSQILLAVDRAVDQTRGRSNDVYKASLEGRLTGQLTD